MGTLRYIDDDSGRIGFRVSASMQRDFDGGHAAPWLVRFYLDVAERHDWQRGIVSMRGVVDDFGDLVLPGYSFASAS